MTETEAAVLVGGPNDGQQVYVRVGAEVVNVPHLLPLPPVWLTEKLGPLTAGRYIVLSYRLARDPLGWHSRDDLGRLRYVYQKM